MLREKHGHEYIANQSNDQSKIIQSFCNMLREKHEFSKLFEIIKIDAVSFDSWKISHDDNTIYFVAHAVTVWKGMIFDSNLKFSGRLTQLNLEYCVDAAYIGIFCGYHFAPRTIAKEDLQTKKYCF
jgi:hypothetical protein